MLPLKDDQQSKKFPFWVIVIIAVNIYVFYLELTSPNPDAFILQYSLVPVLVNFSDPKTLLPFITSQFLHGGFLHIISNMWFLWVFGNNIENKFKALFPVLYLALGTFAIFFQYLFIKNSDIPTLGASGAVAGILGLYYAFFGHHRIKTLLIIIIFITIVDIPASFVLFYWFILQLFNGAIAVSSTAAENSGGIAYFAHVGGFSAGWIIGKILNFGQYHGIKNLKF